MDGLKIVFIASLYEKEAHQFHYLAIIDLLESLGHQVSHAHITDFQIEQLTESEKTNARFHQKILKLIKTADLIVAEVSRQSIGMGYTIAEALKNQTPVLALTAAEIPPITTYLENQHMLLAHQYQTVRGLEKELPFLLSQLEPKKPKKFNLFLEPELDEYLFQTAKKVSLSKSEYLRELIRRDQESQL